MRKKISRYPEQIVGLELEFLLFGEHDACRKVLAFIKKQFPTIDFVGKSSGFWIAIPNQKGEYPVFFKMNGDGMLSSQKHVLEVCLPETNAMGAARLVVDYLYPFLSTLESMMVQNGINVRFLASTHDFHGHRAACQFNASVSVRNTNDLYCAAAPVLVTLPCLTGPGGPCGAGYVRSVRMVEFCDTFLSGNNVDNMPLCYPRSEHFGSPHRAHENMEYSRLPLSILLNLSILSLVHFAYQLNPERFTLRLCNPVAAAKKLSRSLDNTARVRVEVKDGHEKNMTGLEIQEAMLEITESIMEGYDCPGWVTRALTLWTHGIDDVRNNRVTLCSDFQIKKAYIAQCLAKTGLTLEDPKVQSAFSAISKMLHHRLDPDRVLLLSNHVGCYNVLANGFSRSKELKELYSLSLRDIFQFEIGWARIASDSRYDSIMTGKATPLLGPEKPYLAPRAQKRSDLLQQHKENPFLSACWNMIQTKNTVLTLGPPETDTVSEGQKTDTKLLKEMTHEAIKAFVDYLLADIIEEATRHPDRRMRFARGHSVSRGSDNGAVYPDNGMWAVPKDYRKHARICAFVREIVRTDMEQDHNASIVLDEYTPMVFLLSEGINECTATMVRSGNRVFNRIHLDRKKQREIDDEQPDMVYSIFKAVADQKYFSGGAVRMDVIAAIAFLYTKELMETDRYDAIIKRHPRFQCRADPMDDAELEDFPLDERMIAWAVKYAEGPVIVVSHRDGVISERLRKFANAKQVRIQVFPLTILSPEMISGLEKMHFISASLKKQYFQ